MTSPFRLTVAREITQVQFRPTLDWFANRSVAGHTIEAKYEEWQSDKNGNISLFSPKKKEALEIYTRHITHICEYKAQKSGVDSVSDISQIMFYINKQTDISEIRRLGFRTISVFSTDFEFKEITDLLTRKLLVTSQEKTENTIQPGEPHDLAFVFDTMIDDKIKIHTQIGPVKSEEAISRFDRKFEFDLEIQSEGNLYFDIDVSFEKENTSFEVSKLNNIIETSKQSIFNYIKYLST